MSPQDIADVAAVLAEHQRCKVRISELERERDDAIAAHAGVVLGAELAQAMSDRRVDELESTIERLQDSHRRRVQKESDAAWDRGEEK